MVRGLLLFFSVNTDTLRRKKGEGPPGALLDQSQHWCNRSAGCASSVEPRDVAVPFIARLTEPALSQAYFEDWALLLTLVIAIWAVHFPSICLSLFTCEAEPDGGSATCACSSGPGFPACSAPGAAVCRWVCFQGCSPKVSSFCCGRSQLCEYVSSQCCCDY